MDLVTAEQPAEKELDEILAPLVDLLAEKYPQSDNCDAFVSIEISGGQMYWVDSPYLDSVLIELPPALRECKPLVSVVAALLQRSGSDILWFDDADGEEDPYRTPLRFYFAKKVIWMPDNDCFSVGGHLMVDAIEFNAEAAERQVALLVEYLKDDANLGELSPKDLMMF